MDTLKTSLHRFGLLLAFSLLEAAGCADLHFPTADPAMKAPPKEKAGSPETSSIDLGGGLTMEFVLVRPGTFMMGSAPEGGDEDETPLHQVSLTEPFYIGKYEVTQEQWLQIMGNNPSKFKGRKLPVDTVSWNDCQRFIEKLQAKTRRAFALPTEARWEYVCRAGTTTRWNFGEQPGPVGEHAWYEGNSGGTTHSVGVKKSNAWGICDLHGNVAEWCADWYANPYRAANVSDPPGPALGDSRVVRGGAWGDDPSNVRSAYRSANGPDGANDGIGFRCVMLLSQTKPSK